MPKDSNHLQKHIDLISKHEEEFLARRTAAERVGDSLGAFLILQVLLLGEKEVTAVLQIERQIAARIGLPEVAHDVEITQLSQNTSIDDVATSLKETLPSE